MLLHVTPNRDGSFGRLCVSMETVPGWTPVGMKCMNDQGLAMTHAVVPRSETPYDPDKPQFQHNFLEKIVAECATVRQGIALLRAYSLPRGPHGAHVHLMLADSSGDSAIVEWADGEVKVIPRAGSSQIMTNTLLSKPSPEEGPNSRLNRGRRMLADVKEASVASVVSVLREISIHGFHKGDEVGSVDSAVFDVTGRKAYLYSKRDFDHPLILDLDQEIAKAPRTAEFRTLFPNPVPFETGERYENGPRAAKAAPVTH
jgi:choloylglycine hydrolase